MSKQDIAEQVEAQLTQADIDAWHKGDVTDNVESLMRKYGDFGIWGGSEVEPLSVTMM